MRPDDPDLALLAGDRLYALGLARLAELGDLEAVAELADVISLAAQAQAEGDAERAAARMGRGRRGRRARRRRRAGGREGRRTRRPGRRRRRPARRRASTLTGPSRHAPRWDRFRPGVGSVLAPAMADGRKEPKSKYTLDRGMPGAFEGETVTRRRFMNVTAQAAGGIAVAAFALPALGFARGLGALRPAAGRAGRRSGRATTSRWTRTSRA